MKKALKRLLSQRGWYLRKVSGLSWGVDWQTDWARLQLPTPGIIFDVGAHKGESIDLFRSAFPSARIISFEPVAANYAVLRHRHGATMNVQCLNFALGDSEEFADIVLGEDSQTHSFNKPSTTGEFIKERVTVKTLDGVMQDMGVDSLDLLKIDTEGYELNVIAGASTALSSGKIRAVVCEATLDASDKSHTSLLALSSALASHGYYLASIYDQVVWCSPSRLAYFNAFFVRGSADRSREILGRSGI
jgi:FkbM family methyltransferase